MKTIVFATGNDVKFRTASLACKEFGVTLEQVKLEIPEIQDFDGKVVALDKAQRVFEQLQKPVLISDDSWMIPGLRDFPGPFMKFANQTLTTADWQRLLAPLTDRRVFVRQVVVYKDKDRQHLFFADVEGALLKEPRGASENSHMPLVSFDGGKTSGAEALADGKSSLISAGVRTSWHEFGDWLKSQKLA